MPEISHNEFKSHLKTLKESDFAPVYLVFGEEVLFKDVFEALLNRLLPGEDRALCYEPLEGTGEHIYEAVSRLNTFSLTGGGKVVALKETGVFHSKKNESALIEKAKKAFDSGELKKAAGPFLSILGLCGFTLDDVVKKTAKRKLMGGTDQDSGDWLDGMAAYCKENRLSPSEGTDEASILLKAVENGFPEGHHLLITTELADKRKALFKAILKRGTVINCSVPKGERKQDKAAQQKVLQDASQALLIKAGKTLEPGAFQTICEMTGFDLRTFTSGIKKLVDYVGKRKKITRKDTLALLKRTKKDPVYEFTNALAERSIDRSLFFIKSLMADGMHPLQLLSAAANQMRRLLMAKSFARGMGAKAWSPHTPYAGFTRMTMPLVIDHDQELKETIAKWRDEMSGKSSAVKKKAATDLVVAKNPKSPYPVYQTLLKSEKYTRDELIFALETLSAADLKLKSTGMDPGLILEQALFKIL